MERGKREEGRGWGGTLHGRKEDGAEEKKGGRKGEGRRGNRKDGKGDGRNVA